MNGVSPDTYTVTFKTTGYETITLTGITVVQGTAANVSTSLNKTLQNIGRTQARSQSGAFQPAQTTDQYNVGSPQIATTLGKTGSTNEANLLAAIPGASFDSSGYPVLRGGREYEEGFQFEGIDYTDAFTHQFVNSLILNGAANFQVSPGAGDASIGNAGTGAINIVAKRGTNPHFGQLEGDIRAGRFQHELHGEYGWASPNGRYSDYASAFGSRNSYHYGGPGQDALLIGAQFGGRSYDWSNDVLNNFVYKFGKDNGQSLQFFYENTQFDAHLGYNLGERRSFVQGHRRVLPGQRSCELRAHERPNPIGDAVHAGSEEPQRLHRQLGRSSRADQLQPAQRNVQAAVLEQHRQHDVPHDQVLPCERRRALRLPVQRHEHRIRREISSRSKADNAPVSRSTARSSSVRRTSSASAASTTSCAPCTRSLRRRMDLRRSAASATRWRPRTSSLPTTARTVRAPLHRLQPGDQHVRLHHAVHGPAHLTPCVTDAIHVCGATVSAVQLPYSDEASHTNRQDFAFYVKDTFSPTDRLKFDFGLRHRRRELEEAGVHHPVVRADVVHRRFDGNADQLRLQLRSGHEAAARAAASCRGLLPGDAQRRVPLQLRALGPVPPDRPSGRDRTGHGLRRVPRHPVA